MIFAMASPNARNALQPELQRRLVVFPYQGWRWLVPLLAGNEKRSPCQEVIHEDIHFRAIDRHRSMCRRKKPRSKHFKGLKHRAEK
jgi:hypothetical protein